MSAPTHAEAQPALQFREIACPLCAVPVDRTAFWATDRLHGIGDRFRYVKCDRCSLLFMNPQVAPESIGALYPDDYAPHEAAITDARASQAGVVARLLKRLRRWIQNARIDDDVIASLGSQSRVLDVGC